MSFIAFLGCYGSGKSTVIAKIETDLRKRGICVLRGHWRPVPYDGGRNASNAADDPHSAAPRGAISSIAKLGWLGFCWWTGWFRGLRASAKYRHLVFDRFHADLLVDPRRYRYGGPMWVARFASALMPQPDLVIFLDAPPDVLYARKQEVPHASLAAARERYLKLCKTHSRFRVVDASKSPDELAAAVMREIEILKP